MNFNLQDYISKNKEKLKKVGYVLIGLVVLIILWILLIGPYFKFKENEKLFKNSVLEYCDSKTGCMPKEGSYKNFTLEKAYEDVMVKKTLYVANSNKMCDTSSWIRIFNENGTYKTYVYLKCGIFSSNVDHEGPVITLHGDSEIYTKLNSDYFDAGVAKTKDNKDGDISINEVKVTSDVDTSKVGDYTVTYSVFDKMKNKGTASRTVHVVSTLEDIVKESTDDSNTYKGFDVDNFVLYSGILWRIVGINEDESIKLVTEDGIAALSYGEHTYDESNIIKYLNTEFIKVLKNHDVYLKSDSKFCIDTVTNAYAPSCNELSNPNYVGLLSIKDVRSSYSGENTYLMNRVATWLSNRNSMKPYVFVNGLIQEAYVDKVVSVRPVVNLKSDNLYIASGNGKYETPYKLHDYSVAKAGDKLNTRLVGEYVIYSGVPFVITGFDKDNNIILTSAGPLTSADGGEVTSYYSDEDPVKILDNTKAGNLGYKLENEILLSIDAKYMLKGKWKVNKADHTKYYNEVESRDYEGYLAIPNGEDLYSGNNGSHAFHNRIYLLANYLDYGDNYISIVNSSNGMGFEVSTEDYSRVALRVKILLKNDVVINGGTGTLSNPYTLK